MKVTKLFILFYLNWKKYNSTILAHFNCIKDYNQPYKRLLKINSTKNVYVVYIVASKSLSLKNALFKYNYFQNILLSKTKEIIS